MMGRTYEEIPMVELPVQTQVINYTIMEYIKSHNLLLEDLSNLLSDLKIYQNEMIRNTLPEDEKIKHVLQSAQFYFGIPVTTITKKEFNDFLSKVSI